MHFRVESGYCFDEDGMNEIYEALNIPYYKETNFAHLDRFTNSFFLGHLPSNEDYKNKYQIFIWKNGKIIRYYLYNNKIYTEEFMYLHLFSRPISFKVNEYDKNNIYVIYPDVVKVLDEKKINYKYIKRKGKCSTLKFYIKIAYFNRKKLTVNKIIQNFKKKLSLAKTRGYK